jgi:hypothetical protein
MAREWQVRSKGLPPGVAAAFHAVEGGRSLAAIFQLTDSKDGFMIVYHPMGEPQPKVERGFSTVQAARDRLSNILSTQLVVPAR